MRKAGNESSGETSSSSARMRGPAHLRRLRKILQLNDTDWRKFSRLARDGFAEFERVYSWRSDEPLRLEQVPREWILDPTAFSYVARRVLKSRCRSLWAPVAWHFLEMSPPKKDALTMPGGVGLAWWRLAQLGLEPPWVSADLAELPFQAPEDFFHGIPAEDLPDVLRMVLTSGPQLDAWELHSIVGAVYMARLGDRTVYAVFDSLVRADWIPLDVRREFCRGILGCATERERLRKIQLQLMRPNTLDFPPRVRGDVACYPLAMRFPSLRRHAVLALVLALGEPPEDVVQEFLLRGPKQSFYDNHGYMVDLGALDVLRKLASELSPQFIRDRLLAARRRGEPLVRKAAYKFGLAHFGPKFAAPARVDASKVVRKWAERNLAAKAA